jgi:hypothetical protein
MQVIIAQIKVFKRMMLEFTYIAYEINDCYEGPNNLKKEE